MSNESYTLQQLKRSLYPVLKEIGTDRQAAVDTAIAALIDSSPAALNTLNELAAALADDASFSATVVSALAAKQPLITQQSGADQAAVVLGNTDGVIAALSFSVIVSQAECQALRNACEVLADDVRALSTLVHSLRTALIATDIITGAA